MLASSSLRELHPVSERLNRECACIPLDRGALSEAILREVGDAPEVARHLTFKSLEYSA